MHTRDSRLGQVTYLSKLQFLQNAKGKGYTLQGTLCLVCIRYSLHVSKLFSGYYRKNDMCFSHTVMEEAACSRIPLASIPDLSAKSLHCRAEGCHVPLV